MAMALEKVTSNSVVRHYQPNRFVEAYAMIRTICSSSVLDKRKLSEDGEILGK
jgi:hypothetical protein